MNIPAFRRPRLAPLASRPRKEVRQSARARGYSAAWDRASKAYREKHPWCIRHKEFGELVLCDVVDHKVPVDDGGAMWERSNWWGLCNSCHNGWKRDLQDAARKMNDMGLCKVWCDDPMVRPARLR